MEKIKIPIKKIGKYLREISVIVIGVAITLFASYWLNLRSEKRDVSLYMDAIKMELEENIKKIDDEMEFFQQEAAYSDYLLSNDKKSLSLDTIVANFGNNIWYVEIPSFYTDAFDMFKLSGFMRLMDDKELLLSIWKVYSHLDILTSTFQEASKWKIDEIKQEMLIRSQEGRLRDIFMYNYYTTPWPRNLLYDSEVTLEMLRETVRKLEEAL